jgi:hypothetical protein
VNPRLEGELLAHLDTQIASASRLLGHVLAQGRAVRARDVEGVLARLSDVQTEMGRRTQLEHDRTRLLQAAAGALGMVPAAVTLEHLCALISPAGADAARQRSAYLRGLLAEIAREHGINRAVMRQELTFLAHLVRLVGHEAEGGYRPGQAAQGAAGGQGAAPTFHRVLDLRA